MLENANKIWLPRIILILIMTYTVILKLTALYVQRHFWLFKSPPLHLAEDTIDIGWKVMERQEQILGKIIVYIPGITLLHLLEEKNGTSFITINDLIITKCQQYVLAPSLALARAKTHSGKQMADFTM